MPDTLVNESVLYKLGAIEGVLKGVRDTLTAMEKGMSEDRHAAQVEIKELQGRVDHLEKSRIWLIGAATVVAFIVVQAKDVLIKVLMP
jgi:hypothetical protein